MNELILLSLALFSVALVGGLEWYCICKRHREEREKKKADVVRTELRAMSDVNLKVYFGAYYKQRQNGAYIDAKIYQLVEAEMQARGFALNNWKR